MLLFEYYPKVVGQIREIKEICKAEQPEFENIDPEIERLLSNRFILTADEYQVAKLEEEYGLKPIPGQSLEERKIAILVRAVRKTLSFQDVLNLIHNHSKEIDLMPDYDQDQIAVIINDSIDNTRAIYKTLDDILGLNIYIFFLYEITILLHMLESSKKLELKTTFCAPSFLSEQNLLELKTSTNLIESFTGAEVTHRRNLWRLDGMVKLDGSRKMNAVDKREEI